MCVTPRLAAMLIKILLVCVCMHQVLLRTADGLSDDNIKITGPESFVADGSRNLTLTCLATDADPGTAYNWATVACVDHTRNSGTCTLIPTPDQDNKTVVCKAIPSQGRQLSKAYYTLNLNYPPQKPPSITSSRQGPTLQVGDNVTCTVEGGKPLVTAVHMNCTNPDLLSRPTDNVTGGTSVSRSLTISESKTTDGETTCYCWATWGPEPGLFTNTSSKTFQIKEGTNVNGNAAGVLGGVGGLFLVLIGAITLGLTDDSIRL